MYAKNTHSTDLSVVLVKASYETEHFTVTANIIAVWIPQFSSREWVKHISVLAKSSLCRTVTYDYVTNVEYSELLF